MKLKTQILLFTAVGIGLIFMLVAIVWAANAGIYASQKETINEEEELIIPVVTYQVAASADDKETINEEEELIMPVVTYQVAASADDGDWLPSGLVNNGFAIRAGKQSTFSSHVFARFTGVQINGTITSAYIQVLSSSGFTNTVPLRIFAEDAANPAAPSSLSDVESRERTTAYVDWTPGDWSAGVYYDSPSLVSIIQELVDTYTYDGNQAITIFIQDNGAADNTNRSMRTYDHNATLSPPILYIEYIPANAPPTIVPNTADGALLPANATLEFTAADDESDDVRYQVQISDSDQFLDGINVSSELLTGSGTVIHPNPAGGLTWEGYQQVDDRVGMGFMGRGGILDSVDFRFGPHETTPEVTDGSYLARVYAAEGYPVDPAPPIWTATTAYSVGTIIRPTSGANADLHFVYRCVVGGTSGANEPTWPGNGVDWATVTPGTTTNDGSVTWEALPGLHPVGAVSAADTPTPGWLAQSTVYAYAPGTADLTWKTLAFTGANRIRLEAGQWYIVILDWRPNDSVINNSLAVTNAANENAVMPGNVYLDGQAAANNGPRIIEDAWHVVREESTLIDATSGTDAGFANTVDGGDTDPFTSGEKASYTVQPGDELTTDVTYRWRVRAIDPDGSNLWSDWTGGTVTITSSRSIYYPYLLKGE